MCCHEDPTDATRAKIGSGGRPAGVAQSCTLSVSLSKSTRGAAILERSISSLIRRSAAHSPQGQRPVLIPAWANGPGSDPTHRQGLKARASRHEAIIRRFWVGPSALTCFSWVFLGPLAQAVMARAVGTAAPERWRV